MTGPITRAAGHVIVTVWLDRDVEVRSDIARLALWAFLTVIRSLSNENLNEVSNDCVARMDRDGGRRLVGVPIMRKPVYELPRLLGSILQVLANRLVAVAAAQLIHQECAPGDKISVLRPISF